MIAVFGIFLLAFVVYTLYHLVLFRRLLDTSSKTQDTRYSADIPLISVDMRMTAPVSVIICARNEAANLLENLPAILEQDYPDFEVIVVSDHSTDNTLTVLQQMAEPCPQLKVIDFQDEKILKGKRAALLKGIEAASHEHLLLTDADCKPVSNLWIQEMMQPYTDTNIEIVLGYSPYRESPVFLNKLIRYETLLAAIQYMSLALAHRPYMGVGRNLSYRKSTFLKSSQFCNHATLSGDDDLLVGEMANGRNTAVIITPSSQVISTPKTTFSDWLMQKRRHAEAGFNYNLIHKLTLSLFLTSMICLNLLVIPLLLFSPFTTFTLLIFIAKTIMQYAIYIPVSRRLQTTGVLIWLPLLDFSLSLFFVTLGILSVFKIKEWTK